jgi:hypothetical protein
VALARFIDRLRSLRSLRRFVTLPLAPPTNGPHKSKLGGPFLRKCLWRSGRPRPGGSGLFLSVRRSRRLRVAAPKVLLALVLALTTAGIAIALQRGSSPLVVLVGGLGVFGAVFALNSSVHSYLILSARRSARTFPENARSPPSRTKWSGGEQIQADARFDERESG